MPWSRSRLQPSGCAGAIRDIAGSVAPASKTAPRKPEDLSEVSPEPDLWEDEDDVDAFPELNYYEDFYGLGFPELDSMHTTTVKFPTKGRIKRFLKQSIAKETVENFLRSHGFSSDAMDTQSWSHTFLPFERLGPLHTAAKEGKREVLCEMLRQKADINQKTSRGRTAMDVAQAADSFGSHRQIIWILGEVKFGNARSLRSLQTSHQEVRVAVQDQQAC